MNVQREIINWYIKFVKSPERSFYLLCGDTLSLNAEGPEAVYLFVIEEIVAYNQDRSLIKTTDCIYKIDDDTKIDRHFSKRKPEFMRILSMYDKSISSLPSA